MAEPKRDPLENPPDAGAGCSALPSQASRAAIGPYRLIEEMGRGGAGIVWKGRHEGSGALVAIKVARDSSRRHADLLRREIAMLARLGRTRHPCIIAIRDSGCDGGRLWYAMEYVEGVDLRSLLRHRGDGPVEPVSVPAGDEALARTQTRTATVTTDATAQTPRAQGAGEPRPLPHPSPHTEHVLAAPAWPSPGRDDVLWIVAQVADALTLLHGEGIVHGDVTPANIMLRPDLTPVLVDFGTAFRTSAGTSAREVAQVEGMPLGTPGYMAPEQIRRDRLDGRCDLYALGCILHELIHGRPAFAADTVAALLEQHLGAALAGVGRTGDAGHAADEELDQLIASLLHKDPRRRLGHAGEVVLRLARLYRGSRAFPAVRSTTGLYRARLIGRDEALVRIEHGLATAREGRGERLIVFGESGVGKTRLLNEASAKAVALGFEVVSGQCAAFAGDDVPVPGPALHGFVPFLQAYADRAAADTHLHADTHDALAWLAPYEPAIAALLQRAAQATPRLPPEMGLVPVRRALASVLRRYAQEQPLLLILDDLQWADELTLSFWFSDEAEALSGCAVTLLGACRAGQGDRRLRGWPAARTDAALRLSRLSIDEIRDLAREMLGADLLPAGLAETLESRSQGNPFFVAEYLRAFIARGQLGLGPTGWAFRAGEDVLASGPAVAEPVPLPLRDLLQARFAGLDEDARAMLRLAALLGRELHRDLLVGVANAIQAEAAERADVALDQLVGHQILEELGDDHYRFVHDQLREAVLRLIEPRQLTALHREIGNRFELLRGSLAHVTDAQIGVHLANAGDASAALPYLERAAAEAEAVHAVARAIELYRLALRQAEILDHAPDAADVPERRIAEALADVLARSARHDEARVLYARALAMLPAARATSAARLLRKQAESCWTLHQYAEANRLLDLAEQRFPLEAERTTGDWQEWIEVEQARFWTLYYSRRTGPETVALMARLGPIVERHGTPLQRSMAHQCAAADLAGRIRYVYSDEVLAHSRRALAELGDAPAYVRERAATRFQIGFGLIRGGAPDCAAAAELLAEAATEADRMGDATLRARAKTYQAVALRRTGDVAGTERAAQEAFTAGEAAQLYPYMGAAEACQAWVAWKTGRAQLALARAEQANAWWARSGHAFPFRWLAELLLLDCHVARENFEAARTSIVALRAPDQQILAEPLWQALAAALVQLDGGEPSLIGKALRQVLHHACQLGYL